MTRPSETPSTPAPATSAAHPKASSAPTPYAPDSRCPDASSTSDARSHDETTQATDRAASPPAGQEILRRGAYAAAALQAEHLEAVVSKQARVKGELSENVVGNTCRLLAENRMPVSELHRRLASIGHPIPILGLRYLIAGKRVISIDEAGAIAKVFGLSIAEISESIGDYKQKVLRWLLAEEEWISSRRAATNEAPCGRADD